LSIEGRTRLSKELSLVVVMFDGRLDLNFCCLLCGLSTV